MGEFVYSLFFSMILAASTLQNDPGTIELQGVSNSFMTYKLIKSLA